MDTDCHTIPAIITNIFPLRNCFPGKSTEKNSVHKLLYTFASNCGILPSHAPGWADPGKTKYIENAGIFPKKGDSGLDFGQMVACLLCLYGNF